MAVAEAAAANAAAAMATQEGEARKAETMGAEEMSKLREALSRVEAEKAEVIFMPPHPSLAFGVLNDASMLLKRCTYASPRLVLHMHICPRPYYSPTSYMSSVVDRVKAEVPETFTSRPEVPRLLIMCVNGIHDEHCDKRSYTKKH